MTRPFVPSVTLPLKVLGCACVGDEPPKPLTTTTCWVACTAIALAPRFLSKNTSPAVVFGLHFVNHHVGFKRGPSRVPTCLASARLNITFWLPLVDDFPLDV